MANYREQSEWSAEQVLAYILSNSFSYLKIFKPLMNKTSSMPLPLDTTTSWTWGKRKSHGQSISKNLPYFYHLTQYEFIELAFDNNKHSSIKDILKSYRSLTQGQYSESLKDVLEHYRDRKL